MHQDVLIFGLRALSEREYVISRTPRLHSRRLRVLDRGKLPNRALPVASLQRFSMAFSVQFGGTPDRTGAVRVVPPLLSSREQEAEHEAQTAVDLDSTNFRSTILSTAGNGPTYRPYGQA